MAAEFPSFVRSLPEADLPVQGLRGWLLQGESGQVLFLEAHEDVVVPEHTHGDQWGVVIAGSLDLTIRGRTETLCAGRSYVIPAGAPHGARLHAGCRALDYFRDLHRYRVRREAVGREETP